MDEDKIKLEELIQMSDEEIVDYLKDNATYVYEGLYNLDIQLGDKGQYTDSINLNMEDYTLWRTRKLKGEIEAPGHPSQEAFVKSLNEQGKDFEINEETITYRENPEEPHQIVLDSYSVSSKIFDTKFAGVSIGNNDVLVARVDDSFVGFKVDDPDSDNKNVTVEEKN